MARILIIDDDVLVRAAFREPLRRKGHAVVVAESGHDGAIAIEAFAFDVVVVDIFMPGLNGFETIKILREASPDVGVIAMSGYAFDGSPADRDNVRLASELGVSHCLRKPFQPDVLLKAIEQCCPPEGARVA